MARRSQPDKGKGEINEKCDNWLHACYPRIRMEIFQKHEKAEEESNSAKQYCPYCVYA